jgi:hypothetical protein
LHCIALHCIALYGTVQCVCSGSIDSAAVMNYIRPKVKNAV